MDENHPETQENVIPEATIARTLAPEPDLPMDLSSSEAMSPIHLGSTSSPAGSAESKDEEQEPELSLSPELEREPVYYIDEGTSTEDFKFSSARVCFISHELRSSWCLC